MRDGDIAEVGLDDQHRVYVRPARGDFDLVYRAAMEVYWDPTLRRLSHPRPPRIFTPVDWFRQIVAAVADEYGVRFRLTSATRWTDVPDALRAGMEAAMDPGAA